MYIIELFYKLKEKFSSKSKPQKTVEEEIEDENCSHIFVPIDSTKEVLACSKCGFVVRREDIPKKDNKGNFFKR